ncbi:MAG: metallophosphoesterase [Candidatus Aenigmatarchaeota archaeon]
MLISAVADLDILGMNIDPFFEAAKNAKIPDLLLLAGDIYEFRNPEIYGLLIDLFKLKKWDCPIFAVIGNREFDEDMDDVRKICKKRITFLDDQSIELKIAGKKVGIVGTRGALDSPTWWQSTHVSNIMKAYADRIRKCQNMLDDLKVDVKVLLSHYSPTYKTLVGENKNVYSGLGSKKFEDVLIKSKVSFAVHGHAHYGIPLAFVESIPVFNVAFEINRKIVEIDTDRLPKPGLHKFVK